MQVEVEVENLLAVLKEMVVLEEEEKGQLIKDQYL